MAPIIKVTKHLKDCIKLIDCYEANLTLEERSQFINPSNKDLYLGNFYDLVSITFKLCHVNMQIGMYRRIMFWVAYIWRLGNKYLLTYPKCFKILESIFKFSLWKEATARHEHHKHLDSNKLHQSFWKRQFSESVDLGNLHAATSKFLKCNHIDVRDEYLKKIILCSWLNS